MLRHNQKLKFILYFPVKPTSTRRYRAKVFQRTSSNSFPCPNCSSVYNRRNNLMDHLKYVCFQKPRFACPYCKYVTKRTFSVYGHVRKMHPNRKVGYIDIECPNVIVEPQ